MKITAIYCDPRREALDVFLTQFSAAFHFAITPADMDHLVFLPAGDAALIRRAGKYSTLSAVVLKWSRARECHERQGLLVEESALQRAERECLADEDVRVRRRDAPVVRRIRRKRIRGW